MCIDGSTTKGQVAWLKVQKHKWTDGTGNSLAPPLLWIVNTTP